MLATDAFPLLLTAKRASAACSFSVATWYRRVSDGTAPAPVRIGAAVRWRADELRAWTEAGCPDRKTWEALRDSAQRNGRG